MLGAPWDRPAKSPDGMFAAWGVRGPWGHARWRGSYCSPQISQSANRRSSARRETSTGGSRGCQSFHKRKGEIAMKSCSYAHNRRMSHPRTHLQRVVSPDTEDNDRVRHPQTGNDRNQKNTDERHLKRRRNRPWFALLEFAPLIAPLRQPGTKQRWKALWRLALFSSTRLQSKNLISGRTGRPFIPVCTGSGSGIQNPLTNFIAVFS